MKSYDFYAVVWQGNVYCNECLPSGAAAEEVSPIFADSEWDYAPCCEVCGEIHDYITII